MMLTVPAGWKMGQLDAKQPAASHAEFVKVILSESGPLRCAPPTARWPATSPASTTPRAGSTTRSTTKVDPGRPEPVGDRMS
jgi:hypothetical protein